METNAMTDPIVINILAEVEPWFDPGLAGGFLGGGVGVLGAVYGTVVGVLAPRGKGRTYVMAMHWGVMALGAVFLVAGIGAAFADQPYGVWYALLLPGVILLVLMGAFTPVIKQRYRQAEHRRLQAEEFRRG